MTYLLRLMVWHNLYSKIAPENTFLYLLYSGLHARRYTLFMLK
jgi:hypothetical protein